MKPKVVYMHGMCVCAREKQKSLEFNSNRSKPNYISNIIIMLKTMQSIQNIRYNFTFSMK